MADGMFKLQIDCQKSASITAANQQLFDGFCT